MCDISYIALTGNIDSNGRTLAQSGRSRICADGCGGDCGASIAPLIMGSVVDKVSESPWAARIGETNGVSTEQVGMKVGVLTAVVFPVLGIVTLLIMKHLFRKKGSALADPAGSDP